MRIPAETIWDTRVQGVTGILCARADHGVEIYTSATFAQVTTSPPRLIVNPNRTYGIERAIAARRHFSVNVMGLQARSLVRQLMAIRRRQPDKARILNIAVQEDDRDIPFLPQALQSVFCEVEESIESGDRRIYLARILECRGSDGLPLLFTDVKESVHWLVKSAKRVGNATGIFDAAKRIIRRLRPRPPADIQQTTYDIAGLTEPEILRFEAQELTDLSRRLRVPDRSDKVTRRIGICVVGTSWGMEHCRAIRQASPLAKLFICGRDPYRTRKAAKSVGAIDSFTQLEQAANDPRVEALSLAIPHDQHREAVELCLKAGKHVLVEKPIARNLADADAMIAAAATSHKIFTVAENMHFRPAIHEAVSQIDKGTIGEPLYMLVHAGGIMRPGGWKRDAARMGGGVLIDIGVHYVRAMRLIMGEPDKVYATRAMQLNAKMEGEDSVQLIFSSRYGWETHMLLSWASHRGDLPDIVIVGDQGTFALWPRRKFMEHYPVKPRFITKMLGHVRPYWLRDKLLTPHWQKIRISWKGLPENGYVGEMQDFLASIAEDRSPQATAMDARRDLEIVTCCYESLLRSEVALISTI